MKRLSNSNYLSTYLIIIFLISIPISIFSASDTLFDPNQRYEPGQLIIQLAGPIGGGDEKQDGSKDEYIQTGFPEVDALNEQYGVYMAELAWGDDATGSVPETLDNCYVFYFPDEELDMEQIAGEYKEAEGCLEAEPNYYRWGIYVEWPYGFDTEIIDSLNNEYDSSILGELIPNDMAFGAQWGMNNENNDCDIDAPEAWYEIMLLCAGQFQWHTIKISQLDSSAGDAYIDFNRYLENYSDQYDFVEDDNLPWYPPPPEMEFHVEPTMSLYANETNNGPDPDSCIASTNWSGGEPDKHYIYTPVALIRVLKNIEIEGQEWTYHYRGDIRCCVSGMVRSANRYMNIVFMPYGSYDYSAFEDKAAEWLTDNEHDALLIAPAGYLPSFIPAPIPPILYPAALNEVMAIGAFDRNFNITDDTNNSIIKDIYAPGKDIATCWGRFGAVIYDAHGPAIACGFVTGVAAIYMARYGEGGASTRNALITYSDGSMIYRRLNYYKAFMKTHNEPLSEFNKTSSFEKHNNRKISLYQNYPNPVIERTTITIENNENTSKNADIRIYDISGRLVRCFNEVLEPGMNSIVWDAKDNNGSYVKSGVYLLKIECEGCNSSLKMVVDR